VLGTLSNQIRLDWRLAPACGATDCPVCTQTVSDGRLAHATNSLLSGKVVGAATIVHQVVWCAPDCPVSQPRPHQRSPSRTALSGVPRGPWMQRSASPEKEGDRALFTIWWGTGMSGAPTDRRQLLPSKWSSNNP
jgi:hypothetical protein